MLAGFATESAAKAPWVVAQKMLAHVIYGNLLSSQPSVCAVVYLLPHEASYVDFLKVRKIPMQQAALEEAPPDIQPLVQRQAETDRCAVPAVVGALV
jgi:hypothetical protein